MPILVQSGRIHELARTQALVAEADAALGQTSEALASAEAAARTLGDSENQLARVNVLLAVGQTQFIGQPCGARKHLSEAALTAAQAGYVLMERRARRLLGLVPAR